ncbi:TonB-dependent receptor [Hymenobacter busanensis]|uniref:TonB-dependent receptor n=1 Tax=Hymenobacter busanensis TaxID=2607656 RepID=A0A7L4ZWB2_9BACT|nr:TonB-dependent receptor [Hymenobacter busanensis]KAA9339103.1 TonB-dependent receptor [Hymenobacter busanensis]QHJ07135.1 TonB-dependent receptor [Hymenobacter busanensis]
MLFSFHSHRSDGRLVLLAGLLLGGSPAAVAQSTSVQHVHGEVTDAASRTPLPGAIVRWLGTDAAATTDAKGRFALPRSTAATDGRLIVNALGYGADTVAPAAYVRVALRSTNELQEVKVEGRALSYSALTPAHTQVISSKDLTKSACCNLAESFETNASVEVSTSDAASGAKQIQLLGLDGAYSLLTVDNLPALRGLSTPYRLNYLAGPWIESIDIIKGMGSVVNGYESVSGQVNVRLKEPDKTDQLLLNAYVNDFGKFDVNVNTSARISKKLSTALLLHADHLGNRVDRNDDGFLDLPLATQYNVMNKWKYLSGKAVVSELGVGALRETRQGGQVGFRPEEGNPYYGITQETNRYTAYGKTSYTWPTRPYQSLGVLLSGTSHAFNSQYGGAEYGAPFEAVTTHHNTLRPQRQYDGIQRTGLATLLFQSAIGNTAHVYRVGASYLYDDYQEDLRTGRYLLDTPEQQRQREHRARTERVPGAFAEYTYQNSKNLTLVGGVRLDRHNLYGWVFTPRLNVKYDATANTILRVAAGRGFRVANPIADNVGMLVSSRLFLFDADLRPERAWNAGGSLTQYFTVAGRQATFVADYYHTEFQNQVVADAYTSNTLLLFSNLSTYGGRSFSRSFQAEVQVEPVKGLQAKAAYKWLDVRTTYEAGLLPKPLVPKHRLFGNVSYATPFDKWRADLTVQGFGRRPVAHGMGHDAHGSASALHYSSRFALLNAQLTRAFKRIDVYAGAENLTNYRQSNPIDGATEPFGPNFDAAMNWGPIYGRLTYVGVRFRLE